MKPFLEKIIIEGRDGRQRELEFQPGVNIITGVGSKGKSAVVHIIAYCLGTAHCDIPTGKVREFASWFFLLLNVGNTRVIIGRKAPSTITRASDEAYFSQGSNPLIPRPVQANNTTRSACQLLGTVLGLPIGKFRLGMDEVRDEARAYGSMEVPELLPLVLQAQDVIATRTLFGSFDESSSKRRTEVMEIALGIISPNLLLLRARRDRLEKLKRAHRKKRKLLETAYVSALKTLRHAWLQATLAGLVSAPASAPVDLMRTELSQLKQKSTAETMAVSSAVGDNVLAVLEERSQVLRRDMRQTQRGLRHISGIRQATQAAGASLQTQSSRLRVVNLLGAPAQADMACPLCGSKIGHDAEDLLAQMQQDLDKELAFMASIPPDLDEVEIELGQKINRTKAELGEVDAQINSIEKQGPAPTLTDERVGRERMIGAMDALLHSMPTLPGGDYDTELSAIEAELEEIGQQIQSSAVEKNERDVSDGISSHMTAVARGLERMSLGDGILRLNPSFSTIEREKNGQRDPLPILGGAETHVMYHLSALLGLHEHLMLSKSFVPRLLVLDQPSQAYFPSDSDQKKTDWDAVQSIYDTMFRFVERIGNRVQIIVLDHADFSSKDARFREATRYDWHGAGGLIDD